jgi:hypothetical protein
MTPEEMPLRVGKRLLRIVVASDNTAVAIRAQDSAVRLARRARLASEVIGHCLAIDTLSEPERRAEAARQVRDADLVVIALNDGHRVPPLVRTWADQWGPHERPWSATLFVAVDHRAATLRQPAPVSDFLGRAATRCGMHFECWTIDWNGSGYEQCVGRVFLKARTPLSESIPDSRRPANGLSSG